MASATASGSDGGPSNLTDDAPTSSNTPPSHVSLIPDVGEDFNSQARFIDYNRFVLIQRLAPNLKRGIRDEHKLVQLEQLLKYLDTVVQMTPAMRKKTKIDLGLDIMINPVHCFPAEYVKMATELKKKWEDQGWGEDVVGGDVSPGVSPGASPKLSSTSTSTSATITPPPKDHPIFGEHGIMHGVVITRGQGGRTVYRRNLNYRPKNAMVFGDNGLAPGQWWPMQIVALFHGAHGSSQGGIAGSAKMGAYSIVIAGTAYHDLDDDRGDVVYYSGSRSHRNVDPDHTTEPSGFTQALHKSVELGRPVRVLRSASGSSKSVWAPSVGIRYDGLYKITKSATAHNSMGGLFDLFELRRLPGQRDLKEVVQSSPTSQQKRDFSRIQEGY